MVVDYCVEISPYLNTGLSLFRFLHATAETADLINLYNSVVIIGVYITGAKIHSAVYTLLGDACVSVHGMYATDNAGKSAVCRLQPIPENRQDALVRLYK